MKKLLILALLLTGCFGNYTKFNDDDKRLYELYLPLMDRNQRSEYLGGSTVEEREAYAKKIGIYQRLHSFDDKTYQAILTRSVSLGMPEDAVLFSWGPPTSQHRSISNEGEIKEWSYRKYFCNGGLLDEDMGRHLAGVPFNDCIKFFKTVTFHDGKVINMFE